MRPTRALLAVAAAMATVAPAQEPAPLPSTVVQAIEATLAREVARQGIPGLSAALVTDRGLRWTAGYGLADLEHAVPAKAETVYRIASLCKPITATAVLQLAEKGHLDLDAPIQKYVPAFPAKPWPVTARQLLAHLGGVRHLGEDEWGSTRHYTSLESGLEAFKDDPLVHEPGTKPLYSTYGYCLLGCAVEAAAGQPFLDYLRQAIFEPAGMERIRDDDVLAIIPNRAPGYARGSTGELRNSILADTSNKVPGGGLCATAADLARFAAALESGVLLQKETLEGMFARQRTRDGRVTEYALGWRATQRNGRREVWQHGGQPRVSALLYLQPERGVAVAVLCNLEGVAPRLLELARELAEIASR